MELVKLQKMVYDIAAGNGFHENDPEQGSLIFNEHVDIVARWLMLSVTELAEAMEALRKGDYANFKEEIADTIIRLLDLSEAMVFDAEAEILSKCRINKGRSYMHGGKRC